ncbi:MAG: 3-deoxy-D-manno-octulosonic acid transferase [Alistipes sp.]|nr:3-deoxy-D-manno-octulosonic acid transferase [Alistipes sp.]
MWLYDIIITLYAWAIRVASWRNTKARLWVEGRRNLLQRMAETIPADERIVWVHVASLGEFEQGRPLMEEIRRRHPDYKILLTFFSPSGYEIRKNYAGADYIFYLPIDTRRNVRRFLDIVRPEVVIFVKYEFWLNMLLELGRREIRTFVVSAIFRPNSVFFRPWGGLWRRALKSFEAIFVQNNASKLLLGKLGHTNVQVAGDTRFDRVAEIAANAKRVELIERFKGDKPLFVAGSTWGPDEEHLLPIVNENPTLKFVIAPHEMDEGRINHLIEATRGGAVRYTECNETTDFSTTQLLILDTVGLLASVYGSATWSYIGGGFGVGIHNTLEAATFGLPIAFGPNYHKFKEACELIEVGAACSFTTTDELRAWFAPLRDDAETLKQSGEAARSYTQKNQGATKLILDTIFRA